MHCSFFWPGMDTPQRHRALPSQLVYLCVMRTDENARGSQHVSYQVFFTIAVSLISNLVHSIKPHKQDKCPVTNDWSSVSCSDLTKQKAPLKQSSWRGTVERLYYFFLLCENLAGRAIKDITFNWPFAYL